MPQRTFICITAHQVAVHGVTCEVVRTSTGEFDARHPINPFTILNFIDISIMIEIFVAILKLHNRSMHHLRGAVCSSLRPCPHSHQARYKILQVCRSSQNIALSRTSHRRSPTQSLCCSRNFDCLSEANCPSQVVRKKAMLLRDQVLPGQEQRQTMRAGNLNRCRRLDVFSVLLLHDA